MPAHIGHVAAFGAYGYHHEVLSAVPSATGVLSVYRTRSFQTSLKLKL